jgi:glutathione S-transferase
MIGTTVGAASLPVLWHFRFSHFNEKVRWALDHKGVAHRRRALLPGLHVPRMLWLTGRKQVPVLVLDGAPLTDSTRIIAALEARYPAPPLYPDDEAGRRRALELEEYFDEQLGPHVRRALFHDLLPHTDLAVAVLTTGYGAGVRFAYRALFPGIRAAMRADMRIDADGAALGRAKVRAALDRLAAEVQPSGHLVGDRFSVADLTAAALCSPLVLPSEFPYPLPRTPPEPIAAFRASLADHPGFRWVEETYRRHRGRSAEVAA